ncbi:MAG: peptidylprolyl isomerase [Kiritimatiellae bacterium]|nr:peptidylprolyl isomerase [Kiritimatiellia bacterium]MDW8459099.1 peptidylprolyl isomerase [Verrucomicrobiota bacterium]
MLSNRNTCLAAFAAFASLFLGCNPSRSNEGTDVDLSKSTDLFRPPKPADTGSVATGVVATVNGVPITPEMIERELNARAQQLQRRMPSEQLAQMLPRLRSQILDQIIARLLLLQEADRLGLTVSDEEMASFRAELQAALPPGMDLSAILADRGISEEQFRREFADDIRVRKLIEQAVSNAVTVSEEEIRQFYEDNSEQFQRPELATARHLLVAVREGQDREEQRKKAEQLRERLIAGEDFAELVRKETDDPGSRETGGVYTFPRGQMVPEFEEASFTQPIGEIGDIVETRFGFHIIRVEGREPARELTLDEVRTNIAAFLRGQKASGIIQQYINELKEKADIVVHQPL